MKIDVRTDSCVMGADGKPVLRAAAPGEPPRRIKSWECQAYLNGNPIEGVYRIDEEAGIIERWIGKHPSDGAETLTGTVEIRVEMLPGFEEREPCAAG